jgi:hypothetical protein
LIVGFRSALTQKISINGRYRLGFSKGDSDTLGYPAYTYDLAGEYGRSGGDVRNYFSLVGNFSLPWQVNLSPFIVMTSGRPFNIVRGIDVNGDTLITERPTFAELGERCNALNLTTSWCNVSGFDPNAIIPRNWGEGPGAVTINLRLSKNFGFGGSGKNSAAQTTGGDAGGGRGNRGGGGGNRGGGGARGGGPFGGGGFGGFGGGGERRKPYNLNIGLNINNLFNNVNLNTPIGNLASSRFGQSTGLGGGFGGFGGGGGTANRRIELQARFSF